MADIPALAAGLVAVLAGFLAGLLDVDLAGIGSISYEKRMDKTILVQQ
jgi:hypothetical protein